MSGNSINFGDKKIKKVTSTIKTKKYLVQTLLMLIIY